MSILGSLVFLAAAGVPEEIVVTASRTPQPLAEYGGSVSIIGVTDIEARQVITLTDILRGIPGVAVSRAGPPGTLSQVRMRGAEANHVLVLVDGIEVSDPGQGGEFNFSHLTTADIERVEVVRGPQSALWGSDAVGGVISIQTRRGTGAPSVSGFAEGGSFGTRHFGGALSGGYGDIRLRLSGSVLDSDGSNASREGSEDDGHRIRRFSASAGWQPREALGFDLVAHHVEGRNEFDDVDFLTGLPADTDHRTEFVEDYGLVRARLGLLDGRWEQVLTAALTATENDNLDGRTETDSRQGRRYRLAWQSTWSLEAGPGRHNLTVAAEYEKEEFTQRGMATPFGDPNQEQDIDALAFVGEYRLALEAGPAFSGGVRHDDNSDFGDATTWRIGASWPVARTGTRLRMSAGTAVKNPSFAERFGFFAVSVPPFAGNPALRPERSTGWEAGFDQQLGPVQLGFTWFDETLEDEINGLVFDADRGVFTAINTDGKSDRHGLELTLSAPLRDDLSINAAYTLLDAWEPGPAGRLRELRRPRHSGSINLDWRPMERVGVNLDVSITGEQRDLFFPPFPEPSRRVTLDSHTLVTVAGRWEVRSGITLFARVENLLDEEYEEVFGFAQPGISAFGGVRVVFGP
jgi:vitamin B12 transporter